MVQDGNAVFFTQCLHLGRAGNDHAVQPLCHGKRTAEQRFFVKFGEQLVGAKPFCQAGCHDHTSDSLFIGEKLRIELFSCLFAGVTILLIAIEKLLCLVGEYAAAAAFAADFALGERKTEHLLGMTDESERLGICHLHGLRGGAKRPGLLVAMQQAARSLTEKALAVLIEQHHADILAAWRLLSHNFFFSLYFDIHNGIIADFVVK